IMTKIVEVKRLQKKFGKFQALKDVTFDVNEGEVLGYLGPNGAGKSTTIRALLGIIKARAVPQRFLVKMFGTILLKSIKILLMFLVMCISGQTFQEAKLLTCSCICTAVLMQQDVMN